MPPKKDTRYGASTASAGSHMLPGEAAFLLARFEGPSQKTFRQVSPYKIRDELVAVLGASAIEIQVKAIRSGALLLKTRTFEQTEKLLKWTCFGDRRIKVLPADRLNQMEGLVYAPELAEETVETILQESEDQSVASVTRLPSKKNRPNPLLKIRYCLTYLPSHFYAAYMRYEVRPCYPLPRRCNRCLRYGHGQKTCRARAQRCKRCSGEHDSQGCEAPPHCAACGGPHPVTDKSCPVWESKLEEERARTLATSRNVEGEEWPLLPGPPPLRETTHDRPRRPASGEHANDPLQRPRATNLEPTAHTLRTSQLVTPSGTHTGAVSRRTEQVTADDQQTVSPQPRHGTGTGDPTPHETDAMPDPRSVTPSPASSESQRVKRGAETNTADGHRSANPSPEGLHTRRPNGASEAPVLCPTRVTQTPTPPESHDTQRPRGAEQGSSEAAAPPVLSPSRLTQTPASTLAKDNAQETSTVSESPELHDSAETPTPASRPDTTKVDNESVYSTDHSGHPHEHQQSWDSSLLEPVTQAQSGSTMLDSDSDSMNCNSTDDESTPKVMFPAFPDSESEIELSPATLPTSQHIYNLRSQSSQGEAKNVGYRTPLKRSFIPDETKEKEN